MVKRILPELCKEEAPDFVIANAENLTHGNGFTPGHIKEMIDAGVNFFTTGNHVWNNASGVEMLDSPECPVIRPYNYPGKETPGKGYKIIEDNSGKKLLVINLMGQVFMKHHLRSPFECLDEIFSEVDYDDLSAVFIDFHAEATSEKMTLAHYVDGKVSAFVGTHTHVPTADAQILPGGSGYITDAGMVGALDSIIGVKKELIIQKFLTQRPVKHTPQNEGKMVFNAVLFEIDEESKKALNVKHIQKIS